MEGVCRSEDEADQCDEEENGERAYCFRDVEDDCRTDRGDRLV